MIEPLTASEELALVTGHLDLEGILAAICSGRLTLKSTPTNTTHAPVGKQCLPVSHGIEGDLRKQSPHGIFEWRETATTGEAFMRGSPLHWLITQEKHTGTLWPLAGEEEVLSLTMTHYRRLNRRAEQLHVSFKALAHGGNPKMAMQELEVLHQEQDIKEQQRIWRARSKDFRQTRKKQC